jgi:protein-tyrosine-phosphatase
LAIGYLTKLLQQKNIDYVELKHMGVMTPNDLLPTPEVVQLLKEEGVDIRYHRSRPVNDDLIRQADLVLGFTAIHVQTCLRRVPDSKSKTFLLKDYVGLAHTGDQIHDPMGSTMEIFKKYFTEIKQSLQRLVEMEFIALPPEPKEVMIMPTVIKPKPIDADDELPAGYYDEQELATKAAKAANLKNRIKAGSVADREAAEEKRAENKKAASAKTAKTSKAAEKKVPKKAPASVAKTSAKPAKEAKPVKSAKLVKEKATAKSANEKAAAKPAKVKAAVKSVKTAKAPAKTTKAKTAEKPVKAKNAVSKAGKASPKVAPAKKSRK